jgi:DNA-binding winged helix-turn-helix (wHTH) protein
VRLQKTFEEIQPRESKPEPSGEYHFSQFALYPFERQLYCGEHAVQMAPKTFDALVLLVLRAEHLVRKDEMMDALWPGIYVSEANLTNIIVELRKLLGAEAIQTVSKHGYRFMLPVESESGLKQAAYGAFVQARELSSKPSVRSMVRARDLLWLSIAEDPAFAPSWAWLGRCCSYLGKSGVGSAGNLELAAAAFRQAFALDPGLASAHQFYAPLEADLGHSQDALSRLLRRLANGAREPEIFAGLVQVFRFCGLLSESLAAHEVAVSLDSTLLTSVAQTHFLFGEYKAVIENCGKTGHYLDAAAWAALGEKKQAIQLLEERVSNPHPPPVFRGLMNSLLALLRGHSSQAIDEMVKTPVEREPEIVFFIARHFSKLKAVGLAMEALKRALAEGFVCSRALRIDPWFSAIRSTREFPALLEDSEKAEEKARKLFEHIGGAALLT